MKKSICFVTSTHWLLLSYLLVRLEKPIARASHLKLFHHAQPSTSRGFALLISVIFMSVMLLFGLALASIGYKQQVLASSAVKSQYAFYAADAALECALYADQQQNLFAYPPSDPPSAPLMTCNGSVPVSTTKSWSASQWIITSRLSLDANSRCADVTVYKPNGAGTTYIYAQGYDVSCATVASPGDTRFVSRGLNTRY